MTTFDSTKKQLPEVIREITSGKIQLPNFQRGWIWDDEHIRSLLISIGRSFPVGAVMLLKTGGDIRFQVRPIENLAPNKNYPDPEHLILDGQQRLTTLTQVLALGQPVKTFNKKGRPIERFYYVDIERALEDETLEDAFIAVGPDRTIRTNFGRDIELDLSTREKECTSFYFPCNQILSALSWTLDLVKFNPNRAEDFTTFSKVFIEAFTAYELPVISLGKNTTPEAVCLIFEKVNTGGVDLSVFELVTASFAADGYNLREDWYGDESKGREGRSTKLKNEPILRDIKSTDFLQAVSILRSYEKRKQDIEAGKIGKRISPVSAKRRTVLSLKLNDYKKWAPVVEDGFLLAAKFMQRQCFFNPKELPYRTQLIPLATVLSQIGNEQWLIPNIYDRLSQWFWCGVLGELYGGAVETRIANDFEQLMRWIMGDPKDTTIDLPRTIVDAAFQESRLDTLRSRNSAAYKGLNVLVLREGAKDFFKKATVQELNALGYDLDIHHIFPRAWCKEEEIEPKTFDSIVNKTMISSQTNRMIGGNAPSEYLSSIQTHKQVSISEEKMDEILLTHCIPPKSLRDDDFESFMAGRKNKLIRIIESVMVKSVQRDQSL
ncbi:MAG: DUF262 domain-containing protein [Rhodothermaceae bacterium]|nr:DUF262 domain-containing protein [Rhodothermaceae bacterium]MXZ59058.1 DUF262 domain-containing protein [Rhodothermaceae bacterium]MYB90363.1 DUF262 domain-containing protein [Rhodothermaceae bacterium]MYD68461.1 DUF262 domain-containing protein [Rhodothermaceae bacterium]MYG45592.1 DUF262 domain-containing protein [Rhodothermaceae bacterium]